MARNQETVTCPPGDWTQLTNADVTQITFQVHDDPIFVRVTADATKPTETSGILYPPGHGELQKTLTELVTMANPARVWARPVAVTSSPAQVFVDHA